MRRTVLVLIAVACFGGCGEKVRTVSLVECKGKVTYNGNPVAGANVTFAVPGNPISVGTTNANGEFIITTGGRPGAPVGEARVGISKAPESKGPDKTQMTPDQMREMGMKQMASPEEVPASEIPARYASPATSTLTASISSNPAENEFLFPLGD